MKKRILITTLFLMTVRIAFVSCIDDEDPIATPEITGGNDDDPMMGGGDDDPLTMVDFDANGDWTQETLDAFTDRLGINDDATGADESAFAFTTVSTTIGNTVLPTDFTATQTLSGEITGDVTLDANEVYEIVGAVFVRDGGVLNIPAGTFLFANSIEREFVVDFEFLDDDGVIQYNTQTTVSQGFSGDVRETEFIHSVVVPETLNLTMANRLRIVVTIPSSDATLQGNLVMQSKATFYFEIKDRD